MSERTRFLITILLVVVLVAAGGVLALRRPTSIAGTDGFDGQRALELVREQVAFGPRISGAENQGEFIEWLRGELESAGWTTEVREGETLGHVVRNVVARGSDASPQLILGAHYDTRMYADRDPDPALKDEPGPGANDGASGVAVLLELARVLDSETHPTWLVFFDAEDNGRIAGWDWALGSQAFADSLPELPQAVIIVDMVGDADLQLYYEMNSDAALRESIWKTAGSLGYGNIFIREEKHRLIDDHVPFLERGIPAVDIIDFDYRYWHTTQDTADKLAASSLDAVGDTLLAWIETRFAP